ncbi:HAD family hydrolase [Staphylococcus felis]|uniref:HAD family hydrolase n=1 Tax=Staphylococcus felis TaxID=46127 RepID=UPI000E21DA46|nr:HAD family hydrolase [Staphylococcus felis]REI08852.1 HAD family hydrolase [Staphylococcus felis]
MALSWIMFDKDGTLIQFDQSWVKIGIQLIDDVCYHFKIKNKEDVYQKLGVIDKQFKEGSIMASGTLEDMIGIFNQFANQDTANWTSNRSQELIRQRVPENIMYTGVKEMLERLKNEGYHLGIVTSDNDEGVTQFLKQTDTEGLFECVISTNGDGYEKPDSRILQPLWDKGIKKDEVIIVGDTDNDILTGKNAHLLLSIGVRTGLGQAAQFEEADFVIDSVNELPNVLSNRIRD